MNIIYGTPGRLRGLIQSEDFSYAINETPLFNNEVITPTTSQDCNYNAHSGSSNSNDFSISVTDSLLKPGHSFVNNTPSVVTVSPGGAVARIINGAASIDIQTPVGRRRVTRTMTDSAVTAANYWQSFVAGSLGKHIVDSILSMISGKTPGNTTKDMFSSNNYNTDAPAAVRNPNLFAAGIDMSPISIINKNSSGGSTYTHPGLLISPRHIIGAAHYPATGPVVWLDAVGGYHTANLLNGYNVPNTDIRIQYLSAEITNIIPFSVLPTNWKIHLPKGSNELMLNLPCLTKTVHGHSGDIRDSLSMNHFFYLNWVSPPQSFWGAGVRQSLNIAQLESELWYAPIAGGDSGGPLCLVINGLMVIVGAYYYGAGGHFYTDYITQIEAAMNSLAVAQGDMTAYSLRKVSLSGFTAY